MLNNANWCDLVARSNDIGTTFTDQLWASDAPMPPGFSEAVTLRPGAKPDWGAIRGGGGLSVTDSFADQDLAPAGYSIEFEAQWIGLDEVATEANVQWHRVGRERFANWLEEHDYATGIHPALLDVAEVVVVEALQGDRFVAGAILNRSDEVIGLSNVFFGEVDPVEAWRSLATLAHTRFGHAPVVGYEREDTIVPALAAGFRPVGPLRVWAH